ncbi:aminotransferase class I/II-fold pyridoxal phosphate-dependent enzyme [Kocuria kalidii]|uniref:aminotransferase class I/II-fold pyridoxal phosphate-dependent enzyme n=1 Tax=Kocuria kalidii TaxID=3376283 RepID=UPI0037B0EF1C
MATKEKTRLILACNPNHPTGAIVSSQQMEAFMQKALARVLIVIDETYLHFNTSATTAVGSDFFRRFPNVAVLHTLSKAYGLAGLRLGYAIARADAVVNLRKVAVPFPVTNFIWAATGEDTSRIASALKAPGITVRAFPQEGMRIFYRHGRGQPGRRRGRPEGPSSGGRCMTRRQRSSTGLISVLTTVQRTVMVPGRTIGACLCVGPAPLSPSRDRPCR